MQMNALKEQQEEKIKTGLKDIYCTYRPEVVLKNMWADFTENTEIKSGLKKMGISLGADYLLGKVFGRNNSVKGYLLAIAAEKMTNYLVNKHSDAILSGIGKVNNLFKQT